MINQLVKTTRCKTKSTIVYLFFFLLISLLSPPFSSAQTISLSVWPPLLDTVIKPGNSITRVYRLKNLGDDTVITASLIPFVPEGELGHIKLTPTPTSATSYFSLQNNDLSLPATLPIKAGQTQEFVLKINIPEDAPETDHHLTFMFESDTKGLVNHSGSIASVSIGSNLLLTVSNSQPNHTARIEEFKTKKLFDSFSPIDFTLRLKNTSPTRLKAVGQISLTNAFDRQVTTLPIREDNVLGGTIRSLKTVPQSWNSLFPFGKYQATATITPKDSANPITQTIIFYVFPYKAIIILLLLFFLFKKLKT